MNAADTQMHVINTDTAACRTQRTREGVALRHRTVQDKTPLPRSCSVPCQQQAARRRGVTNHRCRSTANRRRDAPTDVKSRPSAHRPPPLRIDGWRPQGVSGNAVRMYAVRTQTAKLYTSAATSQALILGLLHNAHEISVPPAVHVLFEGRTPYHKDNPIHRPMGGGDCSVISVCQMGMMHMRGSTKRACSATMVP